MGVIVAAGRRAGLSFEEAWGVAAITALGYLSDSRATEWWEVFDTTRPAWEDAYFGRRSPLQALPTEVPAAIGYAEPRPATRARRP